MGFKIAEFWEMTIGEIELYANNYAEVLKQQTHDRMFDCYQNAVMTAAFVADGMNGKKIPQFDELFPDLMTEEQKKQQQKVEIEAYKNKWKAFMSIHNRKEGGK